MLKEVAITFTYEEAKLIADILRNAPIRGSLETLPPTLNQMVQILRKMDESFKPEKE